MLTLKVNTMIMFPRIWWSSEGGVGLLSRGLGLHLAALNT